MNRLRIKFTFTPKLYINSLYAALIVVGITLLLLLVDHVKLGEAVITLVYLMPVVWSTAHWGKGPGIAAALSAGLLLAFFFLPPVPNFAVASLDDLLVLSIFLVVAVMVVGPIQENLSRAQHSEREAVLMYELSTILATTRTQEAVAHGVARFLQQRFDATLVTVSIHPGGQPTETAAFEPYNGVIPPGKSDRMFSILDGWGFVGEVQMWKGKEDIPSEDSRLFQDFASQIGQALERTRLEQAEALIHAGIAKKPANGGKSNTGS